MPLRTIDFPHNPGSLENLKDKFLIFYSSRIDGILWCPDCRDVEAILQTIFEPQDGPSAVIVYVGERAEWKSPENPYRGDPWKIRSIPTIIRLKESKEDGRLVEEEILQSDLAAFIEA